MLIKGFAGQLAVGTALTLQLQLPCSGDPFPYRCRIFRLAACHQHFLGQAWNLNVQIDAVQKRAGKARYILLYLLSGVAAGARIIGGIASGCWVHRGNQLEICRKGALLACPGDADLMAFQWLAQYVQHGSGEFRDFVQEEYSAVSECHLAGLRVAATANQRSG